MVSVKMERSKSAFVQLTEQASSVGGSRHLCCVLPAKNTCARVTHPEGNFDKQIKSQKST